MRWTLLVVLFTDALIGAQQGPTKPATLPPGSSVGVQVPSQTTPPPNLAAPRQIAVQGQVPDTYFAGEVRTKVDDHEYWINLLREKVESLQDSRNWIEGVMWAFGFIVPVVLGLMIWARRAIFRTLHDELYPDRSRILL
jgi:hypothetical protein